MGAWSSVMVIAMSVAATAAPIADFEASPQLVQSARIFADITAGAKVGGGGADKVVFLGGTVDDVRVIAIQAIARSDNAVADQSGVLAILRTHAVRTDLPTAADRRLAEGRGLSVFIVGEWSKPAQMWEIGRHGGAMMFRPVDKDGVAGAWRPWP